MTDINYQTDTVTRAPEKDAPWWLPLIGAPRSRYCGERTVRTWWGEFSWGWSGVALDLGAYSSAHLHVGLGFCQGFIRLPFLDRALERDACSLDNPRFGFCFSDWSLHLHWMRATKIIDPPWQKRYLFREFLAADGRWLPQEERRQEWAPDLGIEALKIALPYTYVLDSGEVQAVTATVVRERYWPVWLWFGTSGLRRKAPISDFLRRLQKRFGRPDENIDITFSEEVGSRRGSWKGGCVGCGWTMKPGESVRQALSRMQRERRFR